MPDPETSVLLDKLSFEEWYEEYVANEQDAEEYAKDDTYTRSVMSPLEVKLEY